MNNTDSHPRVLSLSSASTPLTSTANTPMTQSRRQSVEGENFHQEDKTSKTLNGSIKKMWKEIKQHAIEHHRSVNMAYQASYGAGTHARFGAAV